MLAVEFQFSKQVGRLNNFKRSRQGSQGSGTKLKSRDFKAQHTPDNAGLRAAVVTAFLTGPGAVVGTVVPRAHRRKKSPIQHIHTLILCTISLFSVRVQSPTLDTKELSQT